MCEPVTMALASAGAGMTGATVGAVGSAAAASQAALAIKGINAAAGVVGAIGKASAKNQAYVQNAQAAKDAYFIKSKQANLRILQEQTQASQQKQDADLKAMKSQSTASAAAAGSGVQGVDVDRLINDFERSEGVYADRINAQMEGNLAQGQINKLAFQNEALGRIKQVRPVGFAETLFAATEPLASFGLEYADYTSRLDSV